MRDLANKNVLVGITGGIAAYKSADLVRRLRDVGSDVRVAMTKAAAQFVTPLTFQALSGHPVAIDLLDAESESAMDHISLARWADMVLVAPASANFLARLAHGMADDLLATVCLVTEAPIYVAPAMNQGMWLNPATQTNRRLLTEHGVHLLGPAEGPQACGEQGPGRMLEPSELVKELMHHHRDGSQSLAGVRVLVTAGPTREALDPVRFISNKSSGKMGYAVASAAVEAGGVVTLVSGPVALATPYGVRRVDVESAENMLNAVQASVNDCDIFISAAAVADYRPLDAATRKIKKDAKEMTVSLIRTPDILATVSERASKLFTVGFAAETDDVERHAAAKLETKSLDMIAANRVGQRGSGFEADSNALTVLWAGGKEQLPLMSKRSLARRLIALVAARYNEKKS